MKGIAKAAVAQKLAARRATGKLRSEILDLMGDLKKTVAQLQTAVEKERFERRVRAQASASDAGNCWASLL